MAEGIGDGLTIEMNLQSLQKVYRIDFRKLDDGDYTSELRS